MGTVNPIAGVAYRTTLPEGERVANSVSSSSAGIECPHGAIPRCWRDKCDSRSRFGLKSRLLIYFESTLRPASLREEGTDARRNCGASGVVSAVNAGPALVYSPRVLDSYRAKIWSSP